MNSDSSSIIGKKRGRDQIKIHAGIGADETKISENEKESKMFLRRNKKRKKSDTNLEHSFACGCSTLPNTQFNLFNSTGNSNSNSNKYRNNNNNL